MNRELSIITLIPVWVSTVLLFNGCSKEPKAVVKTVYVQSKCPKLQTLEINTTKPEPLRLDYEVIK